MRVAYVATAVPRRCGIATFTADLKAAVQSADPTIRSFHAAINEPNEKRAYPADVRWRIRQGDAASYREAARAINETEIDVVNVQHEFGLYGRWANDAFDDHLRPFLEEIRVPVITTLHTVPPDPAPSIRDAVRVIAERSDAVVVMAHTAARLLRERYGIERAPEVILHGMPEIVPKGRHALKKRLGLEDRALVSTFGLVDPRKGLEYVIDAMPQVVARHPSAAYLIIGQTHPELLKKEGEKYRNELAARVDALGVGEHVAFVNQYLTQKEIVDYLLATDVYVTPYLDPNQITSGTLAYALGAGKAIVSTRYLHAVEALAEGRGILVDFRAAAQIADAVVDILDDPVRKAGLERRAYAYGRESAWPAVGRAVLALMHRVIEAPASAATIA